jgi:hypothetical protein
MATYTNPQSLLTPTDFTLTGPAAGAMASIKNAYAFSDMDAANRDQDLGYLATLNKYQNQMADNPLIAEQRQQNLNAAQMANQSFDSGLTQSVFTSGQQAEKSMNQAKSAAADLQKSIAGANVYTDTHEFLKQLEGSGYGELSSLNNPEIKSQYDALKERAKAAGTPLPDDPFNASSREIIASRANAAINALPELQKRADLLERFSAQGQYVTAPTLAAKQQALADTLANRIKVQQMRGEQATTIESAFVKVMQKDGPLDPNDVVVVQQAAMSNFDKTYQGKNPVSLFYTAVQDPKNELHDAATEANKQGIDPNSFYTFAKQKYVETVVKDVVQSHGGIKNTTNAPAAAPQPTAPVAKPIAPVTDTGIKPISGAVPTEPTAAPMTVSNQGGNGSFEAPASFDDWRSGKVKKGQYYIDPTGQKRIKQ